MLFSMLHLSYRIRNYNDGIILIYVGCNKIVVAGLTNVKTKKDDFVTLIKKIDNFSNWINRYKNSL